MWFCHNVYEVIGILVTFYVGVAISASETEDLARGALLFSVFFSYFGVCLVCVSRSIEYVYHALYTLMTHIMHMTSLLFMGNSSRKSMLPNYEHFTFLSSKCLYTRLAGVVEMHMHICIH